MTNVPIALVIKAVNDDARQIANQLDRIENRLRLNDEIRHFADRTIPPR